MHLHAPPRVSPYQGQSLAPKTDVPKFATAPSGAFSVNEAPPSWSPVEEPRFTKTVPTALGGPGEPMTMSEKPSPFTSPAPATAFPKDAPAIAEPRTRGMAVLSPADPPR